MATVVGNALYVRKASADQLFVFCLTLAIYGFLRDAERPDREARRFLLFYLGIALGVPREGVDRPVPAPHRRPGAGPGAPALLARPEPGARRALVLVVAGPWHALVAWRSPALFGVYVLDAHLLRFFNARRYVEADVPLSTLGFLAASFVWAFPWGVFSLARPEPAARRPRAGVRSSCSGWSSWWACSRSRASSTSTTRSGVPGARGARRRRVAGGRDVGRWLALWTHRMRRGRSWRPLDRRRADRRAGAGRPGRAERVLPHPARPEDPPPVRATGVRRPAAGPGVGPARGLGLATVCWAPWLAADRVRLAGRRRGHDHAADLHALDVVEPHHSVKEVAQAINAQAAPADVLVLEGSLSYGGALPFYTRLPSPPRERRRGLLLDHGQAARGARRLHRHQRVARALGGPAACIPRGASSVSTAVWSLRFRQRACTTSEDTAGATSTESLLESLSFSRIDDPRAQSDETEAFPK